MNPAQPRLPGPPAPPRRRSLSKLPIELKSRIAELAQEQDVRFRDRWSQPVGDRPGSRLVKEVQTEWHGRSLAALSQTDKEWHEIATVFLYRTLTAKQAAARYCLARFIPRHGKLVRTLDISGSDDELEDCRDAFNAFALFPNVVELALRWDNLKRIFGRPSYLKREPKVDKPYESDDDDPETLEGQVDARQNLREASRLRAIKLIGVDSSGARHIIRILPQLTSLHISWNDGVAPEDDIVALRSLRHLRHLSLDPFHPVTWDLTPWSTSLVSLTFFNLTITSTTYSFINLFASSLRSLHISFSDDDDLNDILPPSPLFASPFPNLTSLHLRRIRTLVASAIVASLVPPNARPSGGSDSSHSAGAPLNDLVINIIDDVAPEAYEALVHEIRTLHSRRIVQGREELGTSVEVVGYEGHPSTKSAMLIREDFVWRNGLYGQKPALFRAAAASWDGDQKSVVASEMSSLLCFGEERLREAVRNGDTCTLLAMQDALEKLKGLQLLHQD